MSTRIAIYGAGGFARETLEVVRAINGHAPRTWEVEAFVVDETFEAPERLKGIPVVRPAWLREHPDTQLVVGVGSPPAKQEIVRRLEGLPLRFATLIHPRAWVGHDVTIDEGSILCAGVQITTDVAVGRHVHVNLNATLGHDAVIGAYSTISPGVNLSGHTSVAEGVEIGTGACVIPNRRIGAWSIVGAGATVVADVPARVTVVGTPARVIKHHGTV